MLDDPDGPVYKEYKPRVVDEVDVDALRGFVGFVSDLGADDQSALLTRVAWPEVIVRKNGVVSGFLMRRAPKDYRARLTFGGQRTEELALVQYLLNPQEYLAARGLAVDDAFRLEFLRDTVESLALFHRLGIAVGDLSPNNLLFSTTARPRCFFIDCDSMVLDGGSVLPRMETPDWQVSTVGAEEAGTPVSDIFKFGLLVVRVFAADQQSRDPAAVPARLRRRTVSSLSADPVRRPSPRSWLSSLDAAQRRVGASVVAPDAVPLRAVSSPDVVPGRRGLRWAMLIPVLLGLAVAAFGSLSDDPGSASAGGSPRTGLPTATYVPPVYAPPSVAYLPPYTVPLPRFTPILPPISLLCIRNALIADGVRGGAGLDAAAKAAGELVCAANRGEGGVAAPLAGNAPYDGVGTTIIGFWGEGTSAPRATVQIGNDSGCWQTSVRFTADYDVASVGAPSACG